MAANSQPMITRRELLAGAAGLATLRDDALDALDRWIGNERLGSGAQAAADEGFWAQIQQAFTLDRTMINLNNGGVCPSPRVVQDALRRYIEYSNQAPSYYMWRHLETEVESVRRRLAEAFGCGAEEIAITRNASEALENCLFGFDLQRGDEVLTTTLDYPRMITTIRQRERREGIRMVQVRVPPVVDSMEEIVRRIEEGITPRTKLILFCHVVFLNGQTFPAQAICALGERRGIPVVVDGAHAFAHLPFKQSDLGCEFYGTSLHKWLTAPIGTGFLYVRKRSIGKLWPLMAATAEQKEDIRKFEEIGTHPAANHNAIAEALTFYEMIGPERKAARLRYLRSLWVDRLRDVGNVTFHTNLDPAHSCGLTTVEIVGTEPAKLAGWLWDRHRIFVTSIGHDDFQGIRVTPNVYTTVEEMRRFGDAMLTAARSGIE